MTECDSVAYEYMQSREPGSRDFDSGPFLFVP
jgi:hypothetical protein